MLAETVYSIKRPFHLVKTGILQGLRSQLRYRFPEKKLTILAITGTDGKTTSSTLLYHVLQSAGKKVGLISTVAAYIGEESIDTGFHVTSPGPAQLYAFMQRLVEQGYEYLVLEATSQGIYQYRTWGIYPAISGLTNIDREHLDYHLTYDHYVQAKMLLLNNSKSVVLNEDDESYPRVKRYLATGIKNTSYQGISLLPRALQQAIKSRFAENFNQSNAGLVATMALELGLKPSEIAQAISTFSGIPGRLQIIPNRKKLRIIVDFAHTPQAIQAVLQNLRASTPKGNKVIAVYGSAGLRDHLKRPHMGEIGAKLADLVVFTAEDPRTEDAWAIIRQMKGSLGTLHHKVISIADRQDAISFAINELAKPGDTVAILGKGHEQSMCYGNFEYPWSDQTAVEVALQK